MFGIQGLVLLKEWSMFIFKVNFSYRSKWVEMEKKNTFQNVSNHIHRTKKKHDFGLHMIVLLKQHSFTLSTKLKHTPLL